jgi:hypothetical protein
MRSPSVPRLTAQQAVHTVGKEEHEATVLADGAADDQTNPGQDSTRALNVRNRAEFDPSTDPGVPALGRGMVPTMVGPDAMTQAEMATMNRPGPPVLATQDGRRPTQGQVPMPQRMAPPMMVADAGLSSPDVRPTGDTSPQLQAYAPNGTTNAQLQPVASGSSNKTLFAIVGVGLVLVLSLIGLGVALKPPAKGLLIIELPEAAAGKARVNLNGKPLPASRRSPRPST